MFGFATIVTFLVLSDPALAPDMPKPSWQWTAQERIQRRLNPEARLERRARALEVLRVAGHAPDARQPFDVIEGRLSPELLLPTEIWDHLIGVVYQSDAEFSAHRREVYAKRSADIPLPADFWNRIAPYAKQTIDAEKAFLSVLKGKDRSAAEAAERSRCQALAASLDGARAELGDDVLLRFLYEAVAPSMYVGTHSPWDPQELRRMEEGCR